MNWYYQFYIITNKAIVHRDSFRITGLHTEAVFENKLHIQDIERRTQNVIYDFLRIEDVYVYFHKLEREEPFIFKAPGNAQQIEDLLQRISIQGNNQEDNIKWI